jgi:cold shock CspA family protein
MIGIVTRFEAGAGRVWRGGQEYFVHWTYVRNHGNSRDCLRTGDVVEFEAERTGVRYTSRTSARRHRLAGLAKDVQRTGKRVETESKGLRGFAREIVQASVLREVKSL